MANIQDKIVALVCVFVVMAVFVLVLRYLQNVAFENFIGWSKFRQRPKNKIEDVDTHLATVE